MKKSITTTNGAQLTEGNRRISGNINFGITFCLDIDNFTTAPAVKLKKKLLQKSGSLRFLPGASSEGVDRHDIPCTRVHFPLQITNKKRFYCDDADSFAELARQIERLETGSIEQKLRNIASKLEAENIARVRSVLAIAECKAEIELR